MTPYFNDYISQFSSSLSKGNRKNNKIQAYIIIKPEIQLVFNNALLEGGLFAKEAIVKLNTRQSVINSNSAADIRNWAYTVNYGAVVSLGKFALSFIQNTFSEMRKDTYTPEVGNISLYIIL